MTDTKTRNAAEILAEYGPFDGVERVHGVTYDGSSVWFACDRGLIAFDPATKQELHRFEVPADAGTAFDGKHLWQIAGAQIHEIDPSNGRVLRSIPAPGEGRDSGLTYAEGALWVGEYRARKIHKVDIASGTVTKTIESNRFVTGVTFSDGELWHGTIEDDESEIRRVDRDTGAVLETIVMPKGALVSGLEAAGDRFYAGGAGRSKVRAVRKPRRRST